MPILSISGYLAIDSLNYLDLNLYGGMDEQR
jgi:hypothetical protein